MQSRSTSAPQKKFVLMLLAATGVSILLLVVDSLRNQSTAYNYFVWNLFLAWLPLIFACWLARVLRTRLWSSWPALGISALWLAFLPNSFYMVSDFIHLGEAPRTDLLYDAVMFTSFISVAVMLGVTSLYVVHREIRKRLLPYEEKLWLAGVILLCSFAIYLGRDLRWNSWDLLTNPGGLLFDVSDRMLHPVSFPEMYLTTGIFFVLISSLYGMAWYTVELIRAEPAGIAKNRKI